MKLHELIIESLSEGQFLQAKTIFEKIKIKKSITYQAIHKKLKQMLKEKIICKKNQHYFVNIKYVIQISQKWARLRKKLSE
jgi:predicted transcriptional regulator